MNDNQNIAGKGAIAVDGSLCLVCGACVGMCPTNAMQLDEVRLQISSELCTLCGRCVELCPVEALSLNGVAP